MCVGVCVCVLYFLLKILEDSFYIAEKYTSIYTFIKKVIGYIHHSYFLKLLKERKVTVKVHCL